MSRTIPTVIAAMLAPGATRTPARIWHITRTDGVIVGLTDHPTTLTIGGFDYNYAAGVSATSLRTSTGPTVDSLDVNGITGPGGLELTDIQAGRWDLAAVLISLVSWADLTGGQVDLFRGYFGDTYELDGAFKIELRSQSQLLKQTVDATVVATCPWLFGDVNTCRIGMTGRSHAGVVSATVDNAHLTFGTDTQTAGYYNNGLIVFSTGPNAGLTVEVATHVAGGVITLKEGTIFPVGVGDAATLTQGCDKTWPTCLVLDNPNHFGGFPFIPGNDQALATGGRTS
jgi:uncharacterized phage protein (TIGR02218 family)